MIAVGQAACSGPPLNSVRLLLKTHSSPQQTCRRAIEQIRFSRTLKRVFRLVAGAIGHFPPTGGEHRTTERRATARVCVADFLMQPGIRRVSLQEFILTYLRISLLVVCGTHRLGFLEPAQQFVDCRCFVLRRKVAIAKQGGACADQVVHFVIDESQVVVQG